MKQHCRNLEYRFRKKFGVLPFITWENLAGYGETYLIHKSPNMCLENDKSFYRMGHEEKWAIEYIERLIEIPSAIITFRKSDEQRIYGLQLEMNKLYEKPEEDC